MALNAYKEAKFLEADTTMMKVGHTSPCEAADRQRAEMCSGLAAAVGTSKVGADAAASLATVWWADGVTCVADEWWRIEEISGAPRAALVVPARRPRAGLIAPMPV